MECRKYQEHITAAIDNALSESERERLEAHLTGCPECRRELEVEKLTRQFVKMRCKRREVPAHLMQSITSAVVADNPGESRLSLWRRISASLYFRPALAFALAFIAIVAVLNTNRTPNAPRAIEASLLPANDVIKQSLNNYMAVVRGEIKPQLTSEKEEHIRQFFAGKTDFPVLFPRMNGCKLIGGVLNSFAGKTLAHVVYTHHGSQLVYIYEACWQTVQSGSPLQLAPDVLQELESNGKFVLSQPDGYTLVMWKEDSTLCSAVAQMDEATLLACLNLEP